MEQDNRSQSQYTALWFLCSLVIGGVAWFLTFAQAWDNPSMELICMLIAANCVGALLVAAVLSIFEPKQPLIWSTGVAIPMFGWGLVCLVTAPFNDLAQLLWTGIGVVMGLAALAGALLGRVISRRWAA
jgi:peptidoglycan/LPS O-acetylase OafA/YrhL